MLTKEHSVVNYKGKTIIPDKLNSKDHHHYIEFAKKILGIYKTNIGQTRTNIHYKVSQVFKDEPDCPSKRIKSFCKLLDDVSQYDRDKGGNAEKLRKKVFLLATEYHPIVKTTESLFDNQENEVKKLIAKKLKITWKDIENNLFSDIVDFHKLKTFIGYSSPEALLSRYNIAQIQSTLYKAINMTIWIKNNQKIILNYVKTHNLFCKITYLGNGEYRLFIDGPSNILRNTRRYDINFATFFSDLTTLKEWKMSALIKSRFKNADNILQLSDKDKLKEILPEEHNIKLKNKIQFFKKWKECIRDGWNLEKNSEILHNGQKVFFPDFVFKNENGDIAFLEILEFWTPEYLKYKTDNLEFFSRFNIIIAVKAGLKDNLELLPESSLIFKTSLNIKDVLKKLHTS